MSKWCLITGQIVGSISSDFRNRLLFGRSRPCGRFQGPANWVIVSFKWICHIWFKPQNEILFSNCGFIISIQVVSKMRSFMVFHTFIFNDYCQLQNFKKLLDGKIDSVEIVRDSTLKLKNLNFRNNQKFENVDGLGSKWPVSRLKLDGLLKKTFPKKWSILQDSFNPKFKFPQHSNSLKKHVENFLKIKGVLIGWNLFSGAHFLSSSQSLIWLVMGRNLSKL